MTLTEQVAQFMYTHMAQAPNRKELLKLIQAGEEQYIAKINELEAKLITKGDKEGKIDDVEYPRDWQNFD